MHMQIITESCLPWASQMTKLYLCTCICAFVFVHAVTSLAVSITISLPKIIMLFGCEDSVSKLQSDISVKRGSVGNIVV